MAEITDRQFYGVLGGCALTLVALILIGNKLFPSPSPKPEVATVAKPSSPPACVVVDGQRLCRYSMFGGYESELEHMGYGEADHIIREEQLRQQRELQRDWPSLR